MNIDQRFVLVFKNFREFLNASWGTVCKQFEFDEDLNNDWLQANWELLVESPLTTGDKRVFLPCYGEGAEGYSDRIFNPDADITHEIRCKGKDATKVFDHISKRYIEFTDEGFIFNRFICVDVNDDYIESCPFDFIQVEEFPNSAFAISNIDFNLVLSRSHRSDNNWL
ncbi:hypothetical protein SG34_009185 [Thalassomonas viridans]|uniref:Uncharacterized protein n=1 Tax=Thalassomonas viridans TaxID=137584 RepID=A0AAE9Z5L6_9GAMM|nr:hypothetical protein [Thalassomonas viridans]WDE07038.1 hypothetical protein SG34_009185 [Thalassomonas viridans]